MRFYQYFVSLPERSQTIYLVTLFCSVFAISFFIGQNLVAFKTVPNLQAAKNITDKATMQSFGKIFINNSFCALAILTGFFSFGLSTLFAVVYNGIIIGYTFANIIQKLGLYQSLILTIPHGCIELTYIILFAVLSIRLSIRFKIVRKSIDK